MIAAEMSRLGYWDAIMLEQDAKERKVSSMDFKASTKCLSSVP